MNVVCLEEDAFYALIDEVVNRLSEKHNDKVDKWVDGSDAMSILKIGKSTLQKLRDEGEIEYSKMGKIILYNRFSIEEYIEKNKRETF